MSDAPPTAEDGSSCSPLAARLSALLCCARAWNSSRPRQKRCHTDLTETHTHTHTLTHSEMLTHTPTSSDTTLNTHTHTPTSSDTTLNTHTHTHTHTHPHIYTHTLCFSQNRYRYLRDIS